MKNPVPELPSNWISFLSSVELFQSFEEPLLRELAAHLELVSLEDGQTLIRQGDVDDSLYIIFSGKVRVSAVGEGEERKSLAVLGPGQTVGEIALFTGDARTATVTSVGGTQVAKLSKSAYTALASKYPQAEARMAGTIRRRLEQAKLAFALHLSRLFGDLEEFVLRDLESELELISLKSGEILFRQGDSGDTLHVVVSGRLRVAVRKEDGAERVLAELGCGEIVGEMAVVSGEPRTATVLAIRDTQLAQLSRAGFERLVLKHPKAVLHTFTAKVVERLREEISGSSASRVKISTIAVVPTSRDVPLDEFCRRLTQTLSGHGAALCLNDKLVNSVLGKEDAAQTPEQHLSHVKLVEWLSKQERDYRYVVYEADAQPSEWTKRCLRQADQILFVGNAAGDPAAGEVERALLRDANPQAATRRSLILVHKDGAKKAARTKAWLEARSVDRHHHVRLDSQADFDRLARFLLGCTVGLALGGGFARALAHVGVIRAMTELGIPIDAIGGTSMGAVIGAQWALGWDEAAMIRETCAGCVDSFNDLTLPFLAFKSGKFFSAVIEKFFSDTRIEDLWFPYFCVSANLNRAEVKIHTEGPLTKALLASTRAPVIFPPIVYDGELHVDGGVLNNVPVDLMKTFSNGGTVIGVDVSPPHELIEIHDYGTSLSGWQAAWNRFKPFTKDHTYLPSVLLVIMRTIEFGGLSFKSGTERHADLYLRPPTLQFKRNEFQSAPQIADVGYRYAREQIEAWLHQEGHVFGRATRRR